eukprot:CAMPEP_0196663236 /NCGR_PEP_ID=MMETSP1086-20130531/52056_1 /TAXON_ID=77921 /ORGANISM="Cyanoptyche  gloeocystis , Strain SAG4.97" /LENGTH=56 /DNA_ID=CAMNT_0041998963 /DNA_START=71 /DNA_END=238 /DNA_ORIENTATION=+
MEKEYILRGATYNKRFNIAQFHGMPQAPNYEKMKKPMRMFREVPKDKPTSSQPASA